VVEFLLLSSLRRYPMIGAQRTSLFFFPFAVAMIAEGLDSLTSSRLVPVRTAGNLLVAVVLSLTLLWQLPAVSARFYSRSDPDDLNPSLQELDPRRASVVVLDCIVELRAAPHLPPGFSFVVAEPSLLQPLESRKGARLRNGFYYLTTGTSADAFAKRLDVAYPGRFRGRALTSHLFFFERIP
jgi:hypothetical protein